MPKIELIELYLPDALVQWPNNVLDWKKLVGWSFLVNHSTTKESFGDFDQHLSQYFFNHPTQDISHAALCAYLCDLYQSSSYWIKADPVQYILDMNKGFIAPSKFTAENNAKLILLINEFLSEDNLEFNIIDEQNGLIKSQKSIDYLAPSFVNMINQPMCFDHITGQNKSYIQKINSELQLLLRQNKTVEREPDGFYFWGAGELPLDKPKPKYNKIVSDHYSVLGLAKLADVNFETLNVNQQSLNLNFKADEKILISTQSFSLYRCSGNSTDYINLSVYFDKVLLELIKLIKINQLKKLVLNTGEKTYQLTKSNIFKSYFTKWFK